MGIWDCASCSSQTPLAQYTQELKDRLAAEQPTPQELLKEQLTKPANVVNGVERLDAGFTPRADKLIDILV